MVTSLLCFISIRSGLFWFYMLFVASHMMGWWLLYSKLVYQKSPNIYNFVCIVLQDDGQGLFSVEHSMCSSSKWQALWEKKGGCTGNWKVLCGHFHVQLWAIMEVSLIIAHIWQPQDYVYKFGDIYFFPWNVMQLFVSSDNAI